MYQYIKLIILITIIQSGLEPSLTDAMKSKFSSILMKNRTQQYQYLSMSIGTPTQYINLKLNSSSSTISVDCNCSKVCSIFDNFGFKFQNSTTLIANDQNESECANIEALNELQDKELCGVEQIDSEEKYLKGFKAIDTISLSHEQVINTDFECITNRIGQDERQGGEIGILNFVNSEYIKKLFSSIQSNINKSISICLGHNGGHFALGEPNQLFWNKNILGAPNLFTNQDFSIPLDSESNFRISKISIGYEVLQVKENILSSIAQENNYTSMPLEIREFVQQNIIEQSNEQSNYISQTKENDKLIITFEKSLAENSNFFFVPTIQILINSSYIPIYSQNQMKFLSAYKFMIDIEVNEERIIIGTNFIKNYDITQINSIDDQQQGMVAKLSTAHCNHPPNPVDHYNIQHTSQTQIIDIQNVLINLNHQEEKRCLKYSIYDLQSETLRNPGGNNEYKDNNKPTEGLSLGNQLVFTIIILALVQLICYYIQNKIQPQDDNNNNELRQNEIEMNENNRRNVDGEVNLDFE